MDTFAFQSAKLWVVGVLGLSKDAVHVYVGLGVFVLAAVAFRRHHRLNLPPLMALGVAILGELLDARDNLRSVGHWLWQASLHDVVSTALWPTVLWVLWRTGAVFNDRSAGKSERQPLLKSSGSSCSSPLFGGARS